MVSASKGGASGTYSYEGNNLRVDKVSGSTTTVYIFSGSKMVAEYDNGAAPASPSREYVYSGSQLLAKIDSSGTKYYHQDHLSNRLVTDSTGATVTQLGHFPFGKPWYNSSNDKLLFTTYERDSETGLDYYRYRMLSPNLTRWTTPDPIHSASPGYPQTLDRYSYVSNNPTNLIDPEGACGCPGDDRGERDDWPVRQPRGLMICAALEGSPACRGTTDCSWYKKQCAKATTSSSKFYYCVAAPVACNIAGHRPWANCTRLCLQENDKCLNIPNEDFTACEKWNHAFCFSFCAIACWL